MRPFALVLSEVQKGIVADEAATALAECVAAVQQTGKKGTVTVTLTVAPVSGNDSVVQVSGSVASKPPRPNAPTSFFYPDDAGNLTRNDPNALPLFPEHEAQGVSR